MTKTVYKNNVIKTKYDDQLDAWIIAINDNVDIIEEDFLTERQAIEAAKKYIDKLTK